MNLINLQQPYLLFIGDAPDLLTAKTAKGVAHWRPEKCLAQFRYPECQVDLGLPDMSIADAAAAGAKTMVIGLAPFGGTLPPAWIQSCIEALEAGMDVASGLHIRLSSIQDIVKTAERCQRQIIDVRNPPANLPCGTGLPRSGQRLLTVGTDCCVGKMFTALAIHAELQQRQIPATFRPTGQTGILIEGSGVPVDAVVSDFIAGAVEQLTPANAPEHWDIIEGQGSLFHPAYAGVSLGLLHGAQADVLVVCHEAGRTMLDGMEGYPVRPMAEVIATNLNMARLTNPQTRLGGIAVNTSRLTNEEANAVLAAYAAEFDVPVFDPVRTGVHAVVDFLLA